MAEPSQSWNRQAYKLKFKMQSVSDDDVRKRLLEKPRIELVAKGVFRLQEEVTSSGSGRAFQI